MSTTHCRSSLVDSVDLLSHIPEAWMPTIRQHDNRISTTTAAEGSVSSSHNTNNALDQNPPTRKSTLSPRMKTCSVQSKHRNQYQSDNRDTNYTGLLIFRGKKRKISPDFQGQIRRKIGRFRRICVGKKSKFVEKSADFARFSQEKSQKSQKNWPISRDFSGKKSNIEGFSGANS